MKTFFYHRDIPPFLTALSAVPAMTRLRGVGMNCGCEYTDFPVFRRVGSYSRFDHSLGAALIVWHFTGEMAPAAAALFHDIATPAFAHTVDFMRGDTMKQEATEDDTEELILADGEIGPILARYGLETAQVTDYHRYPIADNDSPRLSADRLEYTLGNALQFGFAEWEELRELYDDLTVVQAPDGQPELAFCRRADALRFGRLALACGAVYVSREDRYAMQILSELLKAAIDRGILAPELLRTDEETVIAALLAHPDTAREWRRFRSLARMVPEGGLFPGRVVRAKKRYIDPLVSGEGRLSALDGDFARAVENYLAEGQEEPLFAAAGPSA